MRVEKLFQKIAKCYVSNAIELSPENNKSMKIMLTGGGTLGSAAPLVAIFYEAKKQKKQWQWSWIGTSGGVEKKVIDQINEIKYYSISEAKFRRYFSFKIFTEPFLFLVAFIKSFFIILKEDPDVVIGAGSYISVPVIWAAKLFGKKILIHQQDIRPTLSNKMCSWAASKITVSFKKSLNDYPKHKTEWTGNPTRYQNECLTRNDRENFLKKLDFNSNLPTLLVSGGSSGSRSLNRWIFENLPRFKGKANIIHITGRGNLNSGAEQKNYNQFEFLGKEMFSAISISDVVVTRAGISTLTELAFFGKPSIVVPMPSTHQEENAIYFHKQNAALYVSQEEFLKSGNSVALDLLYSAAKKDELSKNIKSMSKPGSAKRVIEIIESFISSFDFKNIKHAFLVGIGGISVSAIAKLLVKKGVMVSGFDLAKTDITMELSDIGVQISSEISNTNLPKDIDILIYSEAVPKDNKFRLQAIEAGITELSGAQFWGEFSKNKKTIAVSGTNGKSTTTAILGFIMEKAGLDPTVAVGTKVLQWNSNIRIGKSDWFIIEADEYAAKMLNYNPKIAVITNISSDHLDFYKNESDIVFYFQKWINQMPPDSIIVLNRDDDNCAKLDLGGRKKIEFGISGEKGVRSAGFTVCSPEGKEHAGKNGFNIVSEEDWGYTRILIPGRCNVENALAASCAALCAGVSKKKILKSISEFKGTWRRFEIIGEYIGALVISDYAHHPEGIKSAIEAARGWYPFERLIVLFQPHHRNRTKNLFNDFVLSFNGADIVIISEIFDVAGRDHEVDANISSKQIVDAMKKNNEDNHENAQEVYYASNLDRAKEMLKDFIMENDIILVMGAGDVDKAARVLIYSKD